MDDVGATGGNDGQGRLSRTLDPPYQHILLASNHACPLGSFDSIR